MKKEHWLYVVIAILAIWIIASYATRNKSGDSGLNENGTTTADMLGDDDDVSMDDAVAPINAVGTLSSGATLTGSVVSSDASGNAVMASNQAAGSMVKIDRVSLASTGWVVVHEADAAGNPGWILGAQRFDMGTYADGQVELLRATVPGSKYYVMLHTDDGDKMFDFKLDMPITMDGAAVMTSFMAQ